MKICLYEYLTQEYFHTWKFLDLRYLESLCDVEHDSIQLLPFEGD